jgi:hypothetical protein
MADRRHRPLNCQSRHNPALLCDSRTTKTEPGGRLTKAAVQAEEVPILAQKILVQHRYPGQSRNQWLARGPVPTVELHGA